MCNLLTVGRYVGKHVCDRNFSCTYKTQSTRTRQLTSTEMIDMKGHILFFKVLLFASMFN
jgi:hypothetical protein